MGVFEERGFCVFGLMGRLDVRDALPQRLSQFDDKGLAGDRDFDYLYKEVCNRAIIGRMFPEKPRFAFFWSKSRK